MTGSNTTKKSGLKMVTLPTKSLFSPSEKITVFDDKLKKLAGQMGLAMYEYLGVGLAAPQIGENIKLIVVTDNNGGYKAYVNPRITYYSRETVPSEEGCLSVPEVYGVIRRAAKIHLTYHDLDGKKQKTKAKGMEAIILQHECDHIDGKLFINHRPTITHGEEILINLKAGKK